MPHITFIHGIANKPEENKLKNIWLDALAGNTLNNNDGIDLGTEGVTTSMIYWADVLYEKADEIVQERVANLESTESVAEVVPDPDMSWREELSGKEKKITDELAKKFSFDALVNDDFTPPENTVATLERIPLPWFVKRRMMKWLLRDVHHYLFNYEHTPRAGVTYKVQDEIRQRVLKKLTAVETDLHIVVSHSMGTVIMYDCLKRVPKCPAIDGFMTIGSPLAIDEVQDKLAPEWTRAKGYPVKLKGRWINVYDKLDPVTGFDYDMAEDYKKNGKKVVEVINEQNTGAWRHNISNYMARPKLRKALKSLLKP